jgi:hypothetical protein
MLLWCLNEMNRHLITKLLLAACSAVVLIAEVSAADYAAGFGINTTAGRNDNINLVENDKDKISVTSYSLSPQLNLNINTETTVIELASTFNFIRFDKSEFDSDDQNVALSLSRQLDTSSLGLNVSYVHNSTTISELLTSGRIGTKADRSELYVLSPRWIYTLNEINQIQLIGAYQTQNFGSNAYTAYKNYRAEFDWIRIINERLKLISAVTYTYYQSDDKGPIPIPQIPIRIGSEPTVELGELGTQTYSTRTKTPELQIGADYELSEQSTLSARFGGSRSDTIDLVEDPNNVCSNPRYLRLTRIRGGFTQLLGGKCNASHNVEQLFTSTINWSWQNEIQDFRLNATKSIQPSSNGYAVDATIIEANWGYQLSERNKVLAGVSLLRNRGINSKDSLQNSSLADRDYGSATLQFQRQLTEYWFVTAGAQYSDQKYTQIDYQGSSRAYTLGIGYRPQQWHWSR